MRWRARETRRARNLHDEDENSARKLLRSPRNVKAVRYAEDRSPDLRWIQPPSQSRTNLDSTPVASSGLRVQRKHLAETFFVPMPRYTTAREANALTVAGQWRSFTAFPSILAIAMMSVLRRRPQQWCHGNGFHDMNFYNGSGVGSQRCSQAPKKKHDKAEMRVLKGW
jgi:hypothetical protein